MKEIGYLQLKRHQFLCFPILNTSHYNYVQINDTKLKKCNVNVPTNELIISVDRCVNTKPFFYV